ncbi:MAG: hypothetical protein P4L22_06520 [Candidatus Babeliales bacterium]|nr:hypothetical protein [Candidatus Babeliales bacterium]
MLQRITKYILLTLIGINLLNAADANQVQKDEKIEAKTFKIGEPLDFTIGTHAVYIDKHDPKIFGFFIGASEAKEGNEYAIAAGYRNGDTILSTAPAKITLNSKADQINPLNGAKISLLALISKYPVTVKSGEDNIIYLYNEKNSLLSTPKLNDANDQVSYKIIQLATADNGSLPGSAIFAAVKNNKGQEFGAQGSGIAFAAVEDKTTEIKTINKDKKEEVKSETTRNLVVANADPKDKKTKENKAAPFSGSINSIKINNPAKIISDIVDMHWDETLARLYIALQVRSNPKANSGARAVVACRVVVTTKEETNSAGVKEKNKIYKLYFDPIVTNLAISGNDQIIATGQANTDVSILKVKTMHTSTWLSYLIVLDENKQLYALPLVDKRREKVSLALDKYQGTLAKFDQEPHIYYDDNFFISRAFTKPALNPNDLLTVNNVTAKIGNGPVPIQSGKQITDMFVIGDAVYVTSESGVLYSQPIFDELGRIAAWTNWQSFAIDKKVYGGTYDVYTGQFWYLTSSSDKINILNRTDWQTDDKNTIQKRINSLFVTSGGIQGFFEFPQEEIFVATGFQKIALINSTDMQDIKVFEDKAIKEVGNIIAATMVKNNNNNWLVVGGTNGLAIKFNNAFKAIGNYQLVKKISSKDNYLYVLTDKTFDRIELTSETINNNKLNTVTLTNIDNQIFNPHVTFSDFIVSNKLVLLGTSIGLFRISGAQKLTEINVPGSVGPILKLLLMPVNNVGQLYVLSGYIGFYQAKINRLFVDLSNNKIKPVNDMFVKNQLDSLYDFESFRNDILPIGATLLNSNSRDLNISLALKSTPGLVTGSRAITKDSFNYNLDVNKFNQFYGMLLNSTTGNLIVNGDFGLIINS